MTKPLISKKRADIKDLHITRDELASKVVYSSGYLFYKELPKYSRHDINKPIGNLCSQGYLRANLDGKAYKIHRVIWYLHHGDIPKGMFIDHINGIKTDNRIENLRLVTTRENGQNRKDQKHDKPVGVSKQNGNYCAYIHKEGIGQIYLGVFNCQFRAAATYCDHHLKNHGYLPLSGVYLWGLLDTTEATPTGYIYSKAKDRYIGHISVYADTVIMLRCLKQPTLALNESYEAHLEWFGYLPKSAVYIWG